MMKTGTPYPFIYTIYILFALVALAACQNNRSPEELSDQVEQLVDNFHVAFQDKQIDTLMGFFHSNARLSISGKGVLKGKQEIRSFFHTHFQTTSCTTDLVKDTILISDQIFIYRGQSTGHIQDFESGMTYPLSRFSFFTFTLNETDEIKLFDYTFVDKD
jgi:hypothetical protein